MNNKDNTQKGKRSFWLSFLSVKNELTKKVMLFSFLAIMVFSVSQVWADGGPPPPGIVYVPNALNGTISIINGTASVTNNTNNTVLFTAPIYAGNGDEGDWSPLSIAVDNESVWVVRGIENTSHVNASPNSITKLNLQGQVIHTVNLSFHPYGIAIDPQYVWIAGHDDNYSSHVARINRNNYAVIDYTADLPDGAYGIAVDDNTVWVACDQGFAIAMINKSNGAINNSLQFPSLSTDGPVAIAVDNNSVYFTDKGNPLETIMHIRKFSKSNYQMQCDVNVSGVDPLFDWGPRGIAIDSQYIWVAMYTNLTLWKLNKNNCEVLNITNLNFTSNWSATESVSVDDNFAWVGIHDYNKVAKINKTTGIILGLINVGGDPIGFGDMTGSVYGRSFGGGGGPGDTTAPIITNITTNETDIFYSNASGNNQITLLVSVIDPPEPGASGINYVTANFSALNQTGSGLVNGLKNMTQISGGEGDANYSATINVTNVTNMNFAVLNITARAYDNANHPSNVSQPAVVLLYNMTTPPAGPCMQWAGVTTDLSTITNFSGVNYVLAQRINMSCMFNMTFPPEAPSWLSTYEKMSLINFTSLNMSSQGIGPKLAGLSTTIQVNITPANHFGDSSIYINVPAFSELNTTTNITLFHLPFTSQPNVTTDSGGTATSISWAQTPNEADGNLTFVVNHFSTYYTTDLTAPIISVISPSNGSNTNSTPSINISINGTGTQLSYVSIILGNGSNTTRYIYNATNASNVINNASCFNISDGSELFYCNPVLPTSLATGSYAINVTAKDFGGAAGNNANAVTNFTVAGTFLSSDRNIYNCYPNCTMYFNLTTSNASLQGIRNITITYSDDSGGKMSYNTSVWNGTAYTVATVDANTTANLTIYNITATDPKLRIVATMSAPGSAHLNVTLDIQNDSVSQANITDSVDIDSLAPVIQLLSPTSGTYLNHSQVNVTFNATDSHLYSCSLYVNNTAHGTFWIQLSTGIVSGNITTWLDNLSDDFYDFNLTCSDLAENSNSSVGNFTIDTTAPNVTLNSPSPPNMTNTSTTLQNFNWTATDNIATSLNCSLIINGAVNYTNESTVSGTATNKSITFADGTYVWYVNCTDTLGNVGLSGIRTLNIDTLAPIITIATNETDAFYSNASGNNQITLLANVTDAGVSGIAYVTANFSALNQGTSLVNMTCSGSASNKTCSANLTITNVTGLQFVQFNITAFAYDNAGNNNASAEPALVILYNMTTPPAGPCMQWGASTTNLATKTNFSNVNYVLEVQMNLSNCTGILYNASLMPSWFNNYTTLALINFSSLNFSDPATGPKLANLSNNMNITITALGQFGDSRIYFNTEYFAELNKTTVIKLYHLPFSSQPNVTADADAAGVNSSLTWAQGTGEGNLTFTVNGFSGYNVTDLTAPAITVNSPANGTGLNYSNPVINISINGTGTQLSYVSIILGNGTNTTTYIYNATNASNITNTAGCVNVSQRSELFRCIISTSNLTDAVYVLNITAYDFGGNAPGNSKNAVTNFTVDSNPPVINSVSLNDTYISSGQTVFVTVNATDTFGVANVTANGIGLNNTGGSNIWNGSITLSGPAGAANVTIIARDTANNAATNYSAYIIDNTAPAITINSPANGSTVYNADGNLTLNYTVTEAQIISSNVSIDSNTFTNSSTSNGSISMNFTGIDAGTHTIVITAYDNASLSSSKTTTFIMSAPVNVSQKLANMQASVGNETLTSVSLLDATNTSINYSSNSSLNVTALALDLQMNLQMTVNATTVNSTVTLTFNGSSANWNATNFQIQTNVSGAVGANVSSNAGSNITALVSFVNMSNFLANTEYTSGAEIVFQQPLSGLDVLYIADDVGGTVYKLSNCSSVPTTVTLLNMCYMNTSSNVTIYVPYLGGVALANDTSAPTVNISSPANNTLVNNSYMTFSFDVWESNPAASFCWYNLTNSSGQVSYASLTTANFTQVGTKYSFSKVLSGLRNNGYNITVNCTDSGNRSTQVISNFTISDTTKPVITAISNSVSGSSVTITVTTNEVAVCKYYASDVNYSTMTNFTTTGAMSHSVTISSFSNGAYTYYVRCNDTAGNAMNTSNSTAFSIAVSSTVPCTENWTCAAWTTCGPDNKQTRTCTDSKSCGTTSSKPSELQYCIYVAPNVCSTGCPTGQLQYSYPSCSCYTPTCTTSCPSGQSQNAYPDCSCYTPLISPPSAPGDITITPKTGGAIIIIPSIAAEKKSEISMPSAIIDATGIMSISLTPRNDLSGAKIEFTKLDSKPASVTAPSNTVYKYLEIKATNLAESDLINAVITFKVDKSWVGTKYNATSVVLMRNTAAGWVALDTKLISQTTTAYIFEATTPGFSYFAITAAELNPTVTPPITPPTNVTSTTQSKPIDWTPVIWIVGIVVVIGVVWIAYKAVTSKRKWKPKPPK